MQLHAQPVKPYDTFPAQGTSEIVRLRSPQVFGLKKPRVNKIGKRQQTQISRKAHNFGSGLRFTRDLKNALKNASPLSRYKKQKSLPALPTMQPMIDFPQAHNNISNDNLYNRTNYNASSSDFSAEGASTIEHGANSLPDRDFNYVTYDAADQAIARGGVACPFPWRLHEMLKLANAEGLDDIVSWAPHGRAFIVRKPKEFASRVMTR
jgi:hypothetical protein